MKVLLALLVFLPWTSTDWVNADDPPAEQSASDEDGFIVQILEPTGGKIDRPQDWFFAEAHRRSVYSWIISVEDAGGGKPYETGVKIQVFVGVEKAAGKTAERFLLDFLESKKNEAGVVVLDRCEASESGLFKRVCLETEEGNDHILYSLFWGTGGLDVAVVVIAGTTKDQWETYVPMFRRMEEFELIDMKRFETKQKSDAKNTSETTDEESVVAEATE